MEKQIIFKHIKKLSERGTKRFYMPGHKGKNNLCPSAWAGLDVTEIPGADNLHHPESIILEAQEKLAAIYGAEESAILVGGTTAGIHAAIMSCCGEGESLLVPLNCHRSVYAALAFGRIKGVYMTPKTDPAAFFGTAVTLSQVKAMVEAHPEVRGMILVNPTYYGTVSEVAAIADYLHTQGKPLIVDEAHGAHLRFCPFLPIDAVSAGADIVIQSTHKILGAFTQSSLLHLSGPFVNREKVRRLLTMLQSSSPSYPLMMSVEAAVDEARDKAAGVFRQIDQYWHQYKGLENPEDNLTLYAPSDGMGYDTGKWLFHVKSGNGPMVEERLLTHYNIQCEFSTQNLLLAMTGIGTTAEDLEALIQGVKGINGEAFKEKESTPRVFYPFCEGIPLWEAMLRTTASSERELRAAVGEVAADFVIPYPPGIPVCIPGSVITEEVVVQLLEALAAGETVLGIENGKIMIIEG